MNEKNIIAISEDKAIIIVAIDDTSNSEQAIRTLCVYMLAIESFNDINETGSIDVDRLISDYEPYDWEDFDVPSNDSVLDRYELDGYIAALGIPAHEMSEGWGFPWHDGTLASTTWTDIYSTLKELAEDLGESLRISGDEPKSKANLASLENEQARLHSLLEARYKNERIHNWEDPIFISNIENFCEKYGLKPQLGGIESASANAANNKERTIPLTAESLEPYIAIAAVAAPMELAGEIAFENDEQLAGACIKLLDDYSEWLDDKWSGWLNGTWYNDNVPLGRTSYDFASDWLRENCRAVQPQTEGISNG
jgi:hypothetical protein